MSREQTGGTGAGGSGDGLPRGDADASGREGGGVGGGWEAQRLGASLGWDADMAQRLGSVAGDVEPLVDALIYEPIPYRSAIR